MSQTGERSGDDLPIEGAAASVPLLMLPEHLEQEELDYELQIRAHKGIWNAESNLTQVEFLQQMLAQETPDERAAYQISTANASEISAELRELGICTVALNRLRDLLLTQLDRPDTEILYRCASRWAHYDGRYKRIPETETPGDNQRRNQGNDVANQLKQVASLINAATTVAQAQNPNLHSSTLDGRTDAELHERVHELESRPTPNYEDTLNEWNRRERERARQRLFDDVKNIESECQRSYERFEMVFQNGPSFGNENDLRHMLTDTCKMKRVVGLLGVPEEEADLHVRVARVMRSLDRLILMLEGQASRTNQARTQSTQLPRYGQAQSTMAGEPFTTRLHAMSLDDSAYTQASQQQTGAPAKQDKVTFGGVSTIQNGGKTFDDGQKQMNSTNWKNRPWPYTPNASTTEIPIYHPSAAPSHINESQYQQLIPDRALDEQKMTVFQSQQLLSKSFGWRRYDGTKNEGTKNIPLDEFIGYLRQFKQGARLSDATVLGSISIFFTGSAFTWWSTHGQMVRTIDELEVRLKSRFEGEQMDPTSQLMNFCSRRQGREENLLNYIDDMRKRAYNLRPPLDERSVIMRLVDNANETYKAFLASRRYDSVEDLCRHAEYLTQAKIQKPVEPKIVPKKPLYRPKVNTVEVEQAEGMIIQENEPEQPTGITEDDPIVAEILAVAKKQWHKWQSKQNPNNSQAQHSSQPRNEQPNVPQSVQAKVVEAKNESCHGCYEVARFAPGTKCSRCYFKTKDPSTLHCYGCNAPGVIQRDCSTCQQRRQLQPPKNSSAGLSSTTQMQPQI